MSAHTPGPWAVRGLFAVEAPGLVHTVAETNPTLGGPGRDMCAANARLIAAAPELLAALKALANEINDHVDINNNGGPNWAMRLVNDFGTQVDAAIAKAEGES